MWHCPECHYAFDDVPDGVDGCEMRGCPTLELSSPAAWREEVAHNQAFHLPEGNVQIAFSGGRTSAYMLHEILNANGSLPERAKVIFTNTGREMPRTLDFVQECSDRWGVPVTWLEYTNDEPRYNVVGHNSASRNGEPFEAIIERRGFLPNRVVRFCSIEMKVHTARRFLVDQGWKEWTCAVGIRADEPNRIKPEGVKVKGTRTYPWQPLFNAGVSKRDVSDFWSRQPFDLGLENVNGKTPFGNCDGCFLKSESTLAALAREHPERHQWWERQEEWARSSESVKSTGAQFHKQYSRAALGDAVKRQGDLLFSDESYLCQKDDGECTDF